MADVVQLQAGSTGAFKKVMRGLDMTLFTVCAILVIDQLAASAAIGPQAVFWWIFTMVFFFVPYGLITAELGSSYPDEGGIYAWVKRAFGPRWGGRTAWLWWINVALWQPSVFIIFAGILSALFFPSMTLWMKIGIAIALTWATVWVNVIALDVGKWVPNAGAVFKATIMLVIGFGGFWYASRHGVANSFTWSSMAPSWGAPLAFLPVIVYNFMGFELMSGAGAEMKNPGRDVPVAIVVAGLLIAAFYLLGTVGILIALPLDQINVVSGIVDTFHKLFGDSDTGAAVTVALGCMALYSFFANMVTWTIGANRSAAEAANQGDLPMLFARLHAVHQTPVAAAVVTGVVTTVVIVIYGIMAKSAEDLFWSLYAFSSVVFLLPYLAMFFAFRKLRLADGDRPRPYRVPGGNGVATLLVAICSLFILQAIVFFIYHPNDFKWSYALPIIIGVAITVAIGEVLVRLGKKA
ncbi:MAG: APC family permease [Parvibaculum sp.]|uniref:APC family permease n=1 Tax=Parvibaculum sp. TaxID=2024848 RepID=UPI002851AF0F|nr:APC family permease [Parvibaculum sp.]MDR3499157.1 APC family permease [Parvibaculum sp.]